MKSIPTLLLSCLLPLAALAHLHEAPEHAMPAGTELGVGATFDAHGRLWLASVRDGHVQLQHSDDFGVTLSTPVVVNAVAETIDAHGENHPSVAVGPDGQLYLAWAHPLPRRWTSAVRFARSLDGGTSFSAPINVSHGPGGLSRSFDALVVAGNGDVVLAWLDNGDPNAPRPEAGMPHGASIVFAVSTDDGKTFARERQLMDHSCQCCRIALARAPDGRVATLFRAVYGEDIRDHAFTTLETRGEPATPARVTFSGWQLPACPEQGPGLAIAADGVRHAVWYEASHGPTIWYGQLDPGHPPRHRQQLAGPGAGHADIATHGSNVWVAWNQVDANGHALMLRSSRDGGTHFTAPRALATSTAAVYSPQLLVHDGRVYAAWNTSGEFRPLAVDPATKDAP